ncbi:MAG TPA: NAD-dependent epimerase/dehydratase family protein [Rhodothermales bacterium]
MHVLIFGATGMVGQAVLRECLLDDRVDRVLAVGRRLSGEHHSKLDEVLVSDVADLSPVQERLRGFDACMFCLGVSSVGMTEAEYTRLTFDLTLSAATLLSRLNPTMTFMYVSGTGTDSTEHGRIMWARVKGRTENAILRLPFRASYMFRPGLIVPQHGVTSRTTWTRVAYAVSRPLLPVIQVLAPSYVTTSERFGRAMIAVGLHGYESPILETRDINACAATSSAA